MTRTRGHLHHLPHLHHWALMLLVAELAAVPALRSWCMRGSSRGPWYRGRDWVGLVTPVKIGATVRESGLGRCPGACSTQQVSPTTKRRLGVEPKGSPPRPPPPPPAGSSSLPGSATGWRCPAAGGPGKRLCQSAGEGGAWPTGRVATTCRCYAFKHLQEHLHVILCVIFSREMVSGPSASAAGVGAPAVSLPLSRHAGCVSIFRVPVEGPM